MTACSTKVRFKVSMCKRNWCSTQQLLQMVDHAAARVHEERGR